MSRVLGTLTLLSILTLVIAPAALATRPSTGFNGAWEASDPIDGSNLQARIYGTTTTQVIYSDDLATQACAEASIPVFTSLLIGAVDGTTMHTTMVIAKCGTRPLSSLHGLEIDWFLDDGGNGDPGDDVLTNTFGEEFTRSS